MSHHSEILQKYAVRAKKGLGQNFLVNDDIIKTIAHTIPVHEKNIIEVGPGYGALTTHLLSQGPRCLTLIELDQDMIHILESRVANRELQIDKSTDFEIKKQDVLKYEPSFEKYSVIANIPYYITSPILYHFLYETHSQPDEMVILLQRDVGDKIRKVGGNKTSVLSLFIDLACESIEEICQVSAHNFMPAPKVESAVLRFVLRASFDKKNSLSTLQIIKKGFAERRKKLLSNLEKGLQEEKNFLREIFGKLGLDENVRAEELGIETWSALAKLLKSSK